MNNTYNDIIAAALELPADSRAMLIEELISSLDSASQAEVDAAWRVEIERRLKEIDEGRAKLIPGDEVMAELRARIRR